MNNTELIIYQTEDGRTRIEARLEDETVWLTLDQMSELFQKSRSTINEHILNIYQDGELSKAVSLRKIGISDFSTKPTNFYNLDIIISVGYRVKSIQGTRFRQWATQRLQSSHGWSRPFFHFLRLRRIIYGTSVAVAVLYLC